MPRGKYVNHKGRSRNFTSQEELEEEMKKEKKIFKQKQDTESDGEARESATNSESGSESEDGSHDERMKAKGVSNLIEIENPNRAQKKVEAKTTKTGNEVCTKLELSRREREEIEKQKAQVMYQKLHAEGKTEQARADLARLAIIKQHRAEAAARREAERKEKEDRKKISNASR